MRDRFVVGYSGNLGRAHELGILLDAAERLRHRLEIMFLIIGEGNQKENLQADVTRRGLANVLFKPYQPKEQLPLKGYRSATIKLASRCRTCIWCHSSRRWKV